MSGILAKNHGKIPQSFLREAENNSCWITRKQRKNIPCRPEAEQAGWNDEIKNCGGGCIESIPCGWESTTQVCEWITKIVWSNGTSYCSINFYFHYILTWKYAGVIPNIEFQSLYLYKTNSNKKKLKSFAKYIWNLLSFTENLDLK